MQGANNFFSAFFRSTRILALLVVSLWNASALAQAKIAPVFWELRREAVDGMLLQPGVPDKVRYTRLREYFTDLHCPREHMEEQTVSKDRRNLICTLPGLDADDIVVAARFDHRYGPGHAAQGWSEAVMLPILYNGLKAQPRQHTFVFVELCGEDGEKKFLERFRKKLRKPPQAMVALDTLGLGAIQCFMAPPSGRRTPERAEVDNLLVFEVAFSAQLQGIEFAATQSLVAWNDTLLQQASEIPSILVYSYPTQDVPPSFHPEFEFVAYYLCRMDIRLANLTARLKQEGK